VQHRWLLAPRKASLKPYDSIGARDAGSNLLLSAAEGFKDVQVGKLGPLSGGRGFSSLKFVPGSGERHLIALRTEEPNLSSLRKERDDDDGDEDENRKGKKHPPPKDDMISTYISVYDVEGEVLMHETKLPFDDIKFEGVEFVKYEGR